MAAIQTQSQRVNCTGLVEPCLPYQQFAEQVPATRSSLLHENLSEMAHGGVLPTNSSGASGHGQANLKEKRSAHGVRPDGVMDSTGYYVGIDDYISTPMTPENQEDIQQEWRNQLPVELHIPDLSIEALLDEFAHVQDQSISGLLQRLRSELAATCKIPEHRLVMSSIHGRFIRQVPASSSAFQISSRGLFPVASTKVGLSGINGVQIDKRMGEEVLVRFFVSPDKESADQAGAVRKVVDKLQSALRDSSSKLMKGNLSKLLSRASLTIGYQESYAFQSAQHLEKLSNLALPFVISAFFTGILIWLASW